MFAEREVRSRGSGAGQCLYEQAGVKPLYLDTEAQYHYTTLLWDDWEIRRKLGRIQIHSVLPRGQL